ncbi:MULTISPECIES: hypothetical protein [unclassified Microcella]|uniref:hypothetical protein n=1 Tax=unclassified Microcella TaxID=2630066 RepID=UPI0006F83381|nr:MULTISPECIES: hypothetical protein [unclassified Microcella]KQV25113.1 hypothetical protein ASC54_11715 [Yonghaparkia sp. Root332]KRF31397.1 hypothetical protein ASG83_11520 [Yonghaparkia sp. Soil809]
MKKVLSTAFATALVATGLVLGGASAASAAHCVDSTGTSPGFSWFGAHVRLVDHAEGGNPGPHMGTSGASNCLETSGNPSERSSNR